MEHRRVLAVIDRIAHSSTKGDDLMQSIDGLRRMLKGRMPSAVLVYDTYEDEIDALSAKLSEVRAEKDVAERTRQRQLQALAAEITKLQTQLDRGKKPAQQDSYSYGEVLQAMVSKFGKHHGVGAALIERSTRLGDPTTVITDASFNKWRIGNCFPPYVLHQIDLMTKDDLLPRHHWSDVERQFLAALYSRDETQSNKTLAVVCSREFGCLINERSIKGELNRLRQTGRITQYRLR